MGGGGGGGINIYCLLFDILKEKVHLIWQGGGGGGNEDIDGGLRKFLDTQKRGSEKISGGSENLYTLNPKGGGSS